MTTARPIEIKKHSYRQTQDGIVISFVIHPNDVPASLATAPLGTRYGCALVEIADDETPVSPEEQATRTRPTRDKKRWGELALSQQAAIRCNEPAFQKWITGRAILEEDAADTVRRICGVSSRKSLDTNVAAGARWRDLDADYLFWMLNPEAA